MLNLKQPLLVSHQAGLSDRHYLCGHREPHPPRVCSWLYSAMILLNVLLHEVYQDKGTHVVNRGGHVSTVPFYLICMWLSQCPMKIELQNMWEMSEMQCQVHL